MERDTKFDLQSLYCGPSCAVAGPPGPAVVGLQEAGAPWWVGRASALPAPVLSAAPGPALVTSLPLRGPLWRSLSGLFPRGRRLA
eukprot:2428331-Amphidinium_carterae.1